MFWLIPVSIILTVVYVVGAAVYASTVYDELPAFRNVSMGNYDNGAYFGFRWVYNAVFKHHLREQAKIINVGMNSEDIRKAKIKSKFEARHLGRVEEADNEF